MDDVEILPGITIPADEIRFVADRATGPGGQHVNRSSTRIALLFDLEATEALDAEKIARLRSRLGGRISKDGVLRVVSQDERSQAANKRAAVERFRTLLAEALHRPKTRRPTRPTRGSQRRRVAAKRRRGDVKRDRKRPGMDD